MAKRYYWLKFQMDFFQSPVIKKLRRIAGGDTYTIIYLKLQLMSIPDGGVIKLTGIEDDPADEIALMIDETTDNVAVTLAFLQKHKLLEVIDDTFFLPQAAENIGNESESARRMRKLRKLKETQEKDVLEDINKNNVQKNKNFGILDKGASHCDENVTLEERREEKEKEKEKDQRVEEDVRGEEFKQTETISKIFFHSFGYEPDKSFQTSIRKMLEQKSTYFTEICNAIDEAMKSEYKLDKAEPYVLAIIKNKREERLYEEEWLDAYEVQRRRRERGLL